MLPRLQGAPLCIQATTTVGMNRAHCEPMYSFTMFTRVLWSNPWIGSLPIQMCDCYKK